MKPLTDIASAILDATNCGETVAVTVAKYIREGEVEAAQRLLCKVCTRLSPETASDIISDATDNEPATAEG